MNVLGLMLFAFFGYVVAYYVYGKFLAKRVFKLNKDIPVPAKEYEDGEDYVPTKKGVLFGHHYTSIAGTGPIVGPAIGVIWGWLPAFLWVFLGSIFMGAIHDFGSLVISIRNKGKSISETAAHYIHPRTKILFFFIVFFELLIVVAIFGMVIAVIFAAYPQAVFPVWCEIPIAVAMGYYITKNTKKDGSVVVSTIVAVFIMYVTVVLGHFIPMTMPSIGSMPATGVWTIILLIYAYIASVLPVTMLLQPRDYINAWQLFIAFGLISIGVVSAALTADLRMVAPAFTLHPKGAPSMVPFLFIIIACGAISGFHSLVSTGTSSKQIASEMDAQMIGYGSMLMESALSVLVIIACCAGIGLAYSGKGGATLTGVYAWEAHYGTWSSAAGLGAKINAVVVGSANMLATIGIPKHYGIIIMGVFIASFAGTTLDTATRVQRYVISEMMDYLSIKALSNKWMATLLAVGTALILAFSTGAAGKGALTLWPLFGAINQLLAGLALIVITLYLKKKGPWYWLALIPCLFVLFITLYGLMINLKTFFYQGNWLLVIIGLICLLLSVWVIIEGVVAFFTSSCIKGNPPKAQNYFSPRGIEKSENPTSNVQH
ncbi:MAG: carbon starvation protein A [bacterium]